MMGNALMWMFGISATVLALAYVMILAAVLAAKRRMAACAPPRNRKRSAATLLSMRYRTP
jgi:hypothetical protein